jgi:hypothetical protein
MDSDLARVIWLDCLRQLIPSPRGLMAEYVYITDGPYVYPGSLVPITCSESEAVGSKG